MLRHLSRMRSATDHIQFLHQCGESVGTIPRQIDIPTCSHASIWEVYRYNGTTIAIVETAPQCFDVFEVPEASIKANGSYTVNANGY